MLARALFVILLAMNLATAMWLWLAPSTAASRPASSDPGVAALVLLGESMAGLGDASAELAAAPEPLQSSGNVGGFSCVEIGPFQTQSDLRQAESVLVAVGLGLVAGGTLGNAYDRLVHQAVIDYVSIPNFHTFNFADVAIGLGGLLMLFQLALWLVWSRFHPIDDRR